MRCLVSNSCPETRDDGFCLFHYHFFELEKCTLSTLHPRLRLFDYDRLDLMSGGHSSVGDMATNQRMRVMDRNQPITSIFDNLDVCVYGLPREPWVREILVHRPLWKVKALALRLIIDGVPLGPILRKLNLGPNTLVEMRKRVLEVRDVRCGCGRPTTHKGHCHWRNKLNLDRMIEALTANRGVMKEVPHGQAQADSGREDSRGEEGA